MSEIKGQILGVVLVLAIFGAIGTVLVTAFTDNANNIAKKITTDTAPAYSQEASDKNKTTTGTTKLENNSLNEIELLTF